MATCSLPLDLLRTRLLLLCCFTIADAGLPIRPKYLNNVTDQAALLSFKDGTKDPANALSDWSINVSCNWHGGVCSHCRQRVVALNLHGLSLQGTISLHLANLSFLHFLDLGSNSFHGALPQGLGQFFRLEFLNLSQNQFEGSILQSLCRCRRLQEMSLEHNQFEGMISECLGNLSDLRRLSVRANQLSGPIPLAFGNLSQLEDIDLAHNYMVGNIPDALGSLSYLRILQLSYNNLTGEVPPSIFNISAVQTLDLSGNDLKGNLPQVALPNVQRFFINYNGFIGQIPRSLASCQHLQYLSSTGTQFTGDIPSWLGGMHSLIVLYLAGNNFTGTIPTSLANLSELQALDLSGNMLRGNIPNGLGSQPHLIFLSLQRNSLTGIVPQSIFNNSALEWLALTSNNLTGNIPKDVGRTLPSLKEIYLGMNGFHGQIPASLANATGLETIDFALNKLSGSMPLELGSLIHLKRLSLSGNFLTSLPSTGGQLSIITALTKCRQLEVFAISANSLVGVLPASIGNLSTSITMIRLDGNQIRGSIPSEITNLTNLNMLALDGNELSGMIPSNIGKLHNLQGLLLSSNRLQGLIPSQLYQISGLTVLNLGENMFSGTISSLISNLSNLQKLDLHSNNLSGELPLTFWEMKGLLSVQLQGNSLIGSLPIEIENLRIVYWLDFSGNRLSGILPMSLTKLQMVQYLNLSENSFSGHIPQTLASMVSLETLDLSYNSLTGEIPKSLGLLRRIEVFNLSFNQLEGEIPNDGIFANLTADSFVGNLALCGAPKFQVPMCPKQKKKHQISNVMAKTIIACTIGSFMILVIIILLLVKSYRKKRAPRHHDSVELFTKMEHPLISYREILHATNNFSHSNLVGHGSFGSVYKGILFDGTIVAVKVLNLLFEAAENSFKIECEVMKKVKHRNLLRIITSCTNKDFKALVFQYMPCGSLEHCLYTSSQNLNLLQRLNILIDVACAMEYLHHDFSEPVIHCDLKPSNVLLDDNKTAYVADFGIAKLLVGRKSYTLTETLGTTGYIAPEFGQSGKVSTKVDVYSYGILLLETFTRRRPTDAMFEGSSSLRQWVAAALPHAILKVVDGCVVDERGSSSYSGQQEPTNLTTRNELLVSIMQVGLLCSSESPAERMDMREVGARLKKIREELRISEMP